MTTETPENLKFVCEKIISVVGNLQDGAKKIAPSKDNAEELTILHDIKDVIVGCKEGEVFDTRAIEKALTRKYRVMLQEGKASAFYNYRKVLSNNDLVGHFKTIL